MTPSPVEFSAGRSDRTRQPPIRLTRRGRIVVVAFIVSLILAALWLGAGTRAQALPDNGRLTVVTAPGDTLWSIAERVRPGVDPRITVRELLRLNSLRGAVIQPGQRLAVPLR